MEARCTDLESAAEPTAQATALVFEHGSYLSGLQSLSEIGYRFGKLIYFLDAWEDFESDRRTGAFNPLLATGIGRDWAAGRIREEAAGLVSALADVGAPLEFQSRFRTNIESRLGARFPILHSCGTRAKTTLAARWKQAVVKARSWETVGLGLAPVAAMAFLFPVYARSARSAHECLSMGLNLMALGGLLAAAGGAPEIPKAPEPERWHPSNLVTGAAATYRTVIAIAAATVAMAVTVAIAKRLAAHVKLKGDHANRYRVFQGSLTEQDHQQSSQGGCRRPGLRRTAAGGGVRQRRIYRHRHRRSATKVDAINRGESYIQDIPSEVLGRWWNPIASAPRRISVSSRSRHHQHLRAHAAAQDQRSGHELHRVARARRSRKYFHPGMLVILESTTYPGTTDELVLPDAREART